jgi:PAS domain S-box-containing protein
VAGLTPSTGERRWIGLLPVAVFLVSSALLLSWWSGLAASQRRSMQEHFEVDARRVETKIAERFEAYDQILRATAGLFAASDDVTREEFRRYVEALQLGKAYGELQGIGFVLRIPPGGLAAHEQSVREAGFPDFRVRPEGQRDGYTSVVYLEPFTGRNRRAFGLDGFTEPTRRAAMEFARDRGRVATTRRLTLVQETETDVQPGVIIFLPVYERGRDPGSEEARRAALTGWIYSPLPMRDLMQHVLGNELKHIRLEVFDGAGTEPEHLLFDSGPGSNGPARLSFSIPLPMNQQGWTLKFTAGEPYLAAIRQRPPFVELGVMTLIAFLLTGLSAAAVQNWRARQRAVDLSRSLQESEARWRTTFEHAPVGIFTVDAVDRFLQVNRRYCEITGYAPDELARMRRPDIVHPDDLAIDAPVARKVRDREIEVGTLERRGVRKDGATFWAEATYCLEPAAPGTPAGMIGVLEDVTARHDAEDKFREMAERSLAGILIVQEGRIAYANRLVAALAGVSPGEFVGKSADWARQRIHPDDLPKVRAAAAAASQEVAGTVRSITYRVVLPGGIRKLEQLARPIQHLGRPAMLVFLLDITDRERVEEELRKAQRLESLGLVAGGIAHDFNNLLTAVFGQVELARGHVEAGSPAAPELGVALSALARARDLTRQLLTFATGGSPALKILLVPRLLEDAVRLGLGGSSLRARFDLEADLPPVEADEGQMSQLLNNLLVNARQATSGAGEILVRARRRLLREGDVPGLTAGLHVEIAIQDFGHGIPPEILPRVFDPFFTTRETGTGLGLATSYSIARRHGGHIGIESRVGEGTTVTILLPAATGIPDAVSPSRPPPAPSAPAPRRLRALLMDDEPMVLRVGVKQFGRMGLDVETAATGEDALEKFGRARMEGRPYDLVVLDLTVPGGMGGAQALVRMREIDPGVVAIACSGYFDATVMAEPGRYGFAAVLPKPYVAADLERVLAEVRRKG